MAKLIHQKVTSFRLYVRRLALSIKHVGVEAEQKERSEENELESAEEDFCFFKEDLDEGESNIAKNGVEVGYVGVLLAETDQYFHKKWLIIKNWNKIFPLCYLVSYFTSVMVRLV